MPSNLSREQKLDEIQRLLARAAELEREVVEEERHARDADRPEWAPRGYYTAYYLTAGFVLGGIGALASLMFNVVGSAMTGRHPLEIIRVYLTFPMGEAALSINGGIALGIGCALYLGTGAMYGMFIHYLMTRYFMDASPGRRFTIISGIVVGLWVINFYLILSWLQPALFDGNWIVSGIPWYVGLSTHLVFGWTMLLVAQWGDFDRREFAGDASRS